MITWTNTTATLGQLKPWALNPRLSTKAQAKRLLKSWEDLGQFQTIAVSPEWDVYDGHQRLSALLTVHGPEHCVDVRQSDRKLTDDEHRELVVMAHIGAVGSWDWDKLSAWDAPQLREWGMDADALKALNLDALNLKEMLEADKPVPVEDVEPQVDRAEELRVKWGVEAGQLWQLGDHRLICGDCTDRGSVERVMDGERADAVVTDPPYGQDQPGVTNDSPDKLAGIVRGSVAALPVDDAVVIAFGSPRTFPEWLDAVRDNGHKFERMLWLYKAAQMAKPWRGWLLTSEAILVSSVGDGNWTDAHPYSHDCYYKSEVSGQLPENSGWHGSVKPLDVVVDLVSRVCAGGSIVYEPFNGSGTTLIACERLGRKCRAIEIDPGYVAVAIERWATATGKTPELLNG